MSTELLEPPAAIPAPVRHPWPTSAAAPNYFGRLQFGNDGSMTDRWQAQNIVFARLPFPMRLAWMSEQSVPKIRIHRLCRGAVLAAMEAISRHFERDMAAIQKAGADLFGGAYLFSLNRDGAPSPHTFGAAITLDPAGNPPGRKYKECAIQRVVIDAFKATGARWGGDSVLYPECAEFSWIL